MILESIFGSVLLVQPICKIETSAIYPYKVTGKPKKTAEIARLDNWFNHLEGGKKNRRSWG